jgi:hypothetical protein
MQFLSYNLNPMLNELIAKKKSFVLRKTNSSLKIVYNNNTYLCNMPFFKKKHLYLFQAIKKEILENIEKFKITVLTVKYNEINYFAFNREAIKQFSECKTVVEYDITKAYLTAAVNLNFISKEFFNKFLELPKKIRLIVLGSIASLATVLTYEAGEIINKEMKNDILLTNVWKTICKEVGDKMTLLTALPSYLFFWVDGIFFDYSKNSIEDIETEINKIQNFEFKKIKCLHLVKIKNSIIVFKENNVKKQFYLNYK